MFGSPRLSAAALTLVLVLVGAACNPFGGDDPEPATTIPPPVTEPPSRVGASIDGTLAIGALLPLTGELERFGPGIQAAVRQAIDEINDQGGVLGSDVVLVAEDTASTAEQAGDAARRLIDDPAVDALVGPASSLEVSGGVLEAALEAERLVCSPAASAPRLTTADTKDLFFTMTPNRVGEVEVIAQALREAGHDRIAVLRVDNPDAEAMSVALVDEMTEAFAPGAFEIVADVVLPPMGVPSDEQGGEAVPPPPQTSPEGEAGEAAATPEAAVDEIVRAGPEAVVVFLQPGEAAPTFRAMFDAELLPSAGGAGMPVWVTDWLASEALANAVDPSRPAVVDGVQGVRPAVATAATAAFDDRLRAEQAVSRVELAAEAYDCTILLALAALAAGGDDPNRMKTAMVELTRGGAECADFGSCSSLLLDGQDVRYTGVLGLELNDFGEPRSGVFERFTFDAEGRIVVQGEVGVEMTREPDEAPVSSTTTTTSGRGT